MGKGVVLSMRTSDHPAHTTNAAKSYPAHPPFVNPHE